MKRHGVLFVLHFVVSLMNKTSGYNYLNDFNSAVTRLASESCPYTDFCTSNPRKTNLKPERESCCQPCSCAKDCIPGNCCPDAEVTTSNRTIECKDQYDLFNKHRGLKKKTSHQIKSYYVIDECPTRTNSSLYDGCFNPKTLQDHILVSDVDGAHIYKNGKCAECNGVEKYITWNISVSCFDIYEPQNFMSTNKRDRFVMDNCIIYSTYLLPPPRILESECLSPDNQLNAYRSCNASGTWEIYNKTIEEACNKYSFVYADGNQLYPNVFCFMCNSPENQKIQRVCTTDSHRFTKLSVYPLTVILDMTYQSTVSNTKHMCARNQISDPFTKVCKTLKCTLGWIPVFGSCLKSTLASDGLSVKVCFSVHISNTNLTQRDIRRLVSYVYGNMNIRSAISDAGCGVCTAFYTELNDTGLDYICITAHTTFECNEDELIATFHRYEKSGRSKLEFIMDTVKSTATINFVYSLPAFTSITNIRLEYNYFCKDEVTLKSKFYCHSVQYSIADLINNGVDEEMIKKLEEKSDVIVNATDSTNASHAICIDDYQYIYDLKHNGAKNASTMRMKYLIHLMSLVCLGWNINAPLLFIEK